MQHTVYAASLSLTPGRDCPLSSSLSLDDAYLPNPNPLPTTMFDVIAFSNVVQLRKPLTNGGFAVTDHTRALRYADVSKHVAAAFQRTLYDAMRHAGYEPETLPFGDRVAEAQRDMGPAVTTALRSYPTMLWDRGASLTTEPHYSTAQCAAFSDMMQRIWPHWVKGPHPARFDKVFGTQEWHGGRSTAHAHRTTAHSWARASLPEAVHGPGSSGPGAGDDEGESESDDVLTPISEPRDAASSMFKVTEEDGAGYLCAHVHCGRPGHHTHHGRRRQRRRWGRKRGRKR